jgi:integrase
MQKGRCTARFSGLFLCLAPPSKVTSPCFTRQQPNDRSNWEFRVVIPERLRTRESGTTFKKTLGATYEEALTRYRGIALEWATLRAELERQADAPDRPHRPHPVITYKLLLTTRERTLLDHLVSSWEYRSLDAYDWEAAALSDEDLDAHEADLKQRLQGLQRALRRNTAPDWFVEEIEEHLAVSLGIRLHPECADRETFFRRMASAELKALRLSLERLNPDENVDGYRATPPKPAGPFDDEPDVPTLRKAFDIWANLKTRDDKTVNEYRAFAERFAQYALDAPLERASLAALTGLARERQIGRRWLEQVATEQGIQRTTLKKYRSALATLFSVATVNGLTDINPFAFRLDSLQLRGTHAEESKSNKAARSPFSPELLARYFSGPLFAGPGFDRRLPAPVTYWFPLLLRFTGARPLEISYLMRDDIVLAEELSAEGRRAGHGTASWIYIFSDVDGPGGFKRPVKTGVSLRRIPVPQILLELGFADYVRTVPRGQWLLPTPVVATKPKNRARYALNALGDYLNTTLGVVEKELVTYSFRHTVIDEAREAGVADGPRNTLMGHTEGAQRDKNAGEWYYGARWHPAKPLLKAAAKLGRAHRLPPGFPSWAEFQQRTPDFSGVVRAPKALPLKRSRRTI